MAVGDSQQFFHGIIVALQGFVHSTNTSVIGPTSSIASKR